MKSTRQKRKAPKNGPRPAHPPSAVRKPVPLSAKERLGVWLIGALQIAFGGMLVIKAVLTVRSGTAWDDLGTASRETQPLDFWLFVLVYFVPGAAIAWMGIQTWRTR